MLRPVTEEYPMDISHFGLFDLAARSPCPSGGPPSKGRGMMNRVAAVANDNGAPRTRRPALRKLLRFAQLRGFSARPA